MNKRRLKMLEYKNRYVKLASDEIVYLSDNFSIVWHGIAAFSFPSSFENDANIV